MKKLREARTSFHWCRHLAGLLPVLVGLALSHAPFLGAQTCSIDSIGYAGYNCMHMDNNDPSDDSLEVSVRVFFSDPPTTGFLVLGGGFSGSVHVDDIFDNCADTAITCKVFWRLPVPLDGTARGVSAHFTADSCSLTVDTFLLTPNGCIKCQPAVSPGPVPNCFPAPGTGCSESSNYAPDKDHLDHTPVQYVQVILHVFQLEDPASPGQVHPTDPQNWTTDHIDIIRSWYDLDTPGNVNEQLANQCVDSSTLASYIPDTRIRLLNKGVVGEDLFFHPWTKAWGVGFDTTHSCPLNTVNHGNLLDSVVNVPGAEDAYYVLLTEGAWQDDPNGIDPGFPDSLDCYPGGCTGGFALNFGNNGFCGPRPMALIHGGFKAFMAGTAGDSLNNCFKSFPEGGAVALGGGILGELMHILSVDHNGGNFHWNNTTNAFGDTCDDTPGVSDANLMDCAGDKCNLTECQLGRAHMLLALNKPGFLRYPDGNGGFTSDGNCAITEPDIVIEDGDDILWNGVRSLRSNIVIEDGGRLTITCRVGFPEDATVTVEEGGKLYLLGGELHSNCNDRRWEGVVIEGDQFAGQWPPTSQGYMFSNQDAAIEQANTSIFVDGGGVAFITSTRFLNTGGAIMEQYDRPNFSRFLGCDFDMDGSEFDMGGGPFFHASLVGVRSVTFQNCTFNVGNVPDAQLEELRGVNALSSTFNVRNSTFNGLHNAIAANDGFLSPLSFFNVRGCTFDGNHTGIHTWGAENFTVTEDTFFVGGAPFDGLGYEPMGIGMGNNSTGFRIEGNTFRRGTGSGSDDLMGILAEDCGTAANNIDGNAFYDLEIGNQAQGNNRGGFEGLQYWCNYNTLNDRDFLVIDDGNGIAPSQGNGEATRDTFSHSSVFSDGDFRNEVGLLSYFHRQFNAETPNPPYTGYNPFEVSEANKCPWDRGGGGDESLTSTEWQQIKTAFNTSRDNWRNERDTLDALMDGGDTQDVLSDISGVNQSTVSQVTQHLLNLSPYLSTAAMQAVIAQDTVFSSTNLDDILSANPDGLRSAAMQALIRSDFPQALADSILVDAGNTTTRTGEQNEVARHRTEMHRLADILIRDIIKDTLGTDTTLLRTWLSNKENLEADYAVVGTYVSTENFAQAWVELDSIPLDYDLTTTEQAEHGHYEDLLSFWENLLGSGRTVMQLGQSHIDTLEAIADSSNAAAGAIAKGILNSLYGYNYQVVPLGGGGQQQSMAAPPSGGYAQTQGAAILITAFPNPADKQVKFSWQLPEGIEVGIITVSDIQGRTVFVQEVESRRGVTRWNTGQLEQGIYLYQLAHKEGASETYKLVLIK